MPIKNRDPRTGRATSSPISFNESFEKYVKDRAKEEGISEQEYADKIFNREFSIIEFDESTGKASLKFVSKDEKAIKDMTPSELYDEFKDLRDHFAPITAGVDYHKCFLVGSGFDIVVDDPKDKHQNDMKDNINKLCAKIYMDYYKKGIDKLLYLLVDDALTYGVGAAEIVYDEDVDFNEFLVVEDDDKVRIKLEQEIKNSEWKKFKGIRRLKIITGAAKRLTPHFDKKSEEILYWVLDDKMPKKIGEEIEIKLGLKSGEEEVKLLPWQVFYISWNMGKSIITPVLTVARMLKKIQDAIGKGFERWANKKYFFVLGSEKRSWSGPAMQKFLKYMELMIQNQWTGIPVEYGFDVKEIGGEIFEGTNLLNYLTTSIANGMGFPRDFLEYGRTQAGDKAWLAWQVKYGSSQRQLRRDIENQLFRMHLLTQFGRTYDIPKQGVSQGDREKKDVYVPKIVWKAEGRWQQGEEIKSLLGLLNVANPVGPELKLAVEKRIAEILHFGEIEFPTFKELREQMAEFAKIQEQQAAEKQTKMKKRLEKGVSKRKSMTGEEKKVPPQQGSTRNPKLIKEGQQVAT